MKGFLKSKMSIGIHVTKAEEIFTQKSEAIYGNPTVNERIRLLVIST